MGTRPHMVTLAKVKSNKGKVTLWCPCKPTQNAHPQKKKKERKEQEKKAHTHKLKLKMQHLQRLEENCVTLRGCISCMYQLARTRTHVHYGFGA